MFLKPIGFQGSILKLPRQQVLLRTSRSRALRYIRTAKARFLTPSNREGVTFYSINGNGDSWRANIFKNATTFFVGVYQPDGTRLVAHAAGTLEEAVKAAQDNASIDGIVSIVLEPGVTEVQYTAAFTFAAATVIE